MRAVLIALMLLLVAPEALAGGADRKSKTVTVLDYTSPAWDGVIAQTVIDFNAVLPKRAPHLVYVRKAVVACDVIAKQTPKQKGNAWRITVCSTQETHRGGYGETGGSRKGTSPIGLSDDFTGLPHAPNAYDIALDAFRAGTACHEFMHILTGISDNYGAAPDTSCVWGTLSSPGPFDVAYAKRAYKKHGRR